MFGFLCLLNAILDKHKFKKIWDNYRNNYSDKVLSRLIELEPNTIIDYDDNIDMWKLDKINVKYYNYKLKYLTFI